MNTPIKERVAAAFKGLAIGLVAGLCIPFIIAIPCNFIWKSGAGLSLALCIFLIPWLINALIAVWMYAKQNPFALAFGVVSVPVSAVISFFLAFFPVPPS